MNKQDLTVGNPLTKLILFSLPLVGGSLFQQLYNFIDTLIVGRLIGIDAVAAVGAYYPLSFLIIGFIQGSSIGFSIPLSQSVGAHDELATKQFFTNGVWLSVIYAIVLTPLMIVVASPLLKGLNTPTNIMSMALTFTTISFIGIPANILYNYSAAALRAFGDSIHPLHFLIISLVLNVILDLVFILQFHMGVAGAAWATVISEFVGGLLNIALFFVGHSKLSLQKAHWRFSLPHVRKMSVIGIPMGFEYCVSAIGAIIMQDAINRLGSSIVAAQSAADKIRQLFTLPMESVGAAMATYQAQNFGAKNRQRIKRGITNGVLIQVAYSIISFIVVNLAKVPLVTMVLGTDSPATTKSAVEYLTIISFFFPIHGLLMIFRNTLQGWGHSLYAIISGFGELLGRSIGSFIALGSAGFVAICYSNPIAWAISLVYCVFTVWQLFIRDELS
ncbi:MATE family efflux transporter [Lentilactobacillus kisonensis]|uniref:MATE efflux family protein n=3 Tax=Lentilactobacillus kisonensis TaxID=481722 RepID=H1LCA8_9LACO|nr:MATE family efflux transporter [Lentilactobacillus kisonensis]EHO54148.1 MATE efflux family protein [Lentilactobacillus kisonensis F0435]KRL22704.1 MATE efflux family protein [Lentilactobacillus kisonensis DSM 19906 = JCM 15041]